MKKLAASLIEASLAAGARQAEALVKTGATRSVNLDAGGRVNWTRTAEGGVALRLVRQDGASGFASACGPRPDEETIGHLVHAALDAARPQEPGPSFPPGPGGDGRGLGIFDPRLHAATPGDLEGLLDEAASEALRVDPRMRRLDSASLAASSSEVWLRNSSGFEGAYRQTLVHLSLGLLARGSGSSLVVKRSRTARSLSAFSPALFGDDTARLAATALDGRPPVARIVPALLAPAAAAEVLRHFSRTLVPPGPAPGTSVGARLLTIIDDGRLPGGVASAPFNGEGVATRRTTVVARGQFSEMIHDTSSAARWGATSTGNGIRVSFRDAPRRMPSNLFIAPGGDEPADLMAALGEAGGGVWLHTLRPTPAVRGEGPLFAALGLGRWIEQGRPAGPIAGALVTWPIAELLHGVIGVGNDLTFGFPAGAFGAPSLLVRQIELRPA